MRGKLSFALLTICCLFSYQAVEAIPIADLNVTKSAPSLFIDLDSDGVADSGDTLGWSIDVTNNGPNIATNVFLTDLLDENLSLFPLSIPGWSTSSNTTYWLGQGQRLTPFA